MLQTLCAVSMGMYEGKNVALPLSGCGTDIWLLLLPSPSLICGWKAFLVNGAAVGLKGKLHRKVAHSQVALTFWVS